MSRYFPKGINIVESDTTGIEGLRLVSGIIGSQMTIAIINNSATSREIRLNSSAFSRKSFNKYIYSETLRPVDGDNFPVPQEEDIVINPEKGIIVEIPANSFVLYTSFES